MQALQQIVNGVNVDQLVDTINAIEKTPDLGKFTFRANNEWLDGAHNRTSIQGFYGAGQEDTSRSKAFVYNADEPPVLLGANHGANPVEYVLAALASCLTTSLVFYAAAQGVKIEDVELQLEGDLDVRGFLGLSEDVRNGYENIQVTLKVKGEASEEQLEKLVELVQRRSPVFDIISNPVPVSVRMEK